MLAARGETMPAQLVLETHGDSWFGYELKPGRHQPPTEIGQTVDPAPLPPPASKKPPENIRKPALKMPFVHLIVQREARELSGSGASAVADLTDPLQPDDTAAQARKPHWRIGFEDIVPAARLLPALRRHLGAVRSGRIDIDKLTDQLATGTLPARLPRRKIQRWHPELVVLLDFSERLWPYRWDMHQLAERLLQVCGRSGVSLRIIQRGPLWRWSDWCAHQNHHLARVPPEFSWSMPAVGTPILLVSDLGLLLGPESSVCCAWREFIWQLRMAQLRPLALAPLGIEQLHAGLCRQLRVLRWSPDASAHPERVIGKGSTAPAGIDDLLAMVATTRRTDPPLLRAMRKLNPVAPMNAGLEGAAWCHSSVETGLAATVKNEAAAEPLQRFSEMPPDLQLKLNERRRKHHAHLRRVVEHEETLLWATHVSEATALAGSKEIQTAVHFMERLAALLQLPDSDPGVWLQVANGIVHRAGSLMSKAFDDELRKPISSVLNNLLNGVIQAQGGKGSAPDWANPGQLLSGPEAFGWLVRDAASGYLLLQAQAPGQGQTGLGEALRLDRG
ncbi:hypothetical protein, partial [Plasticicumulans sp.]|uniref:hypothetical protein n=1 Tax=Plasticicumulans sp. TaxID=2307179 RepID=UPI003964873E